MASAPSFYVKAVGSSEILSFLCLLRVLTLTSYVESLVRFLSLLGLYIETLESFQFSHLLKLLSLSCLFFFSMATFV